MTRISSESRSPRNQIQARLMALAVVFVFLCSLILTFSPAVRQHSLAVELRWQQWGGFVTWLIGYAVLYSQANKILPDHDPYLLPVFSLLNGWGLIMIFRLDPSYGFRQTIWTALGLLAVTLALHYRSLLQVLRRYKYVWLISAILLTLLTFFIGTYPGGSGPALWLNLGSFYFQPSELLKLLLVVFLAAYLADRFQSQLGLMQLLSPTLVLIGLAVLILVAQRDLGTASLFIILYTVVIYLASGKRSVLLISVVLVLITMVVGYLVFDVIQLRVAAWLNPWLDPRNRSYQIVQSLIAVANGGLFGRGIGLGSPGVVPVAQSDFIFSAILEEFGVAGGIFLVCLFAFLTIRGITIALHAPNQYQRFLAAGLTVYFAAQSILIMGGTIRLLPLTGVTLPFISYGGTSLVVSFAAGLLLIIISNHAEDHPATIDRTRPYVLVGGVFLVAFTAICVLVSYWGVVRSDALLGRIDNPRRAISDRYVYRGIIMDRNSTSLTQNSGEVGSITRELMYPPLSSVIGYSDPNFGQAGIESKLDGYLRGVSGNSAMNVTLTRLIYGQYPPGFDIRLSIDLPLQKKADNLMQGSIGAMVLLNADSGEILVMSSSPTFDANQLEQNMSTWMQDESAPLLNRVTQGLYPPGTTTAGIILARFLSQYTPSTVVPTANWSSIPGSNNFCALYPGKSESWGKLISSGCIEPLVTLSRSSTVVNTLALYNDSGLFSKQNLPLESNTAVQDQNVENYDQLFSGSADILVSPIQVAEMAATLSNGGKVISPQLAITYKTPQNGWQLFNLGTDSLQLPQFDSASASSMLLQEDFPGWEISSYAIHQDATISWYVAGTPPGWYGTPLTLVLALEDRNPLEAKQIGRELFMEATAAVLK